MKPSMAHIVASAIPVNGLDRSHPASSNYNRDAGFLSDPRILRSVRLADGMRWEPHLETRSSRFSGSHQTPNLQNPTSTTAAYDNDGNAISAAHQKHSQNSRSASASLPNHFRDRSREPGQNHGTRGGDQDEHHRHHHHRYHHKQHHHHRDHRSDDETDRGNRDKRNDSDGNAIINGDNNNNNNNNGNRKKDNRNHDRHDRRARTTKRSVIHLSKKDKAAAVPGNAERSSRRNAEDSNSNSHSDGSGSDNDRYRYDDNRTSRTHKSNRGDSASRKTSRSQRRTRRHRADDKSERSDSNDDGDNDDNHDTRSDNRNTNEPHRRHRSKSQARDNEKESVARSNSKKRKEKSKNDGHRTKDKTASNGNDDDGNNNESDSRDDSSNNDDHDDNGHNNKRYASAVKQSGRSGRPSDRPTTPIGIAKSGASAKWERVTQNHPLFVYDGAFTADECRRMARTCRKIATNDGDPDLAFIDAEEARREGHDERACKAIERVVRLAIECAGTDNADRPRYVSSLKMPFESTLHHDALDARVPEDRESMQQYGQRFFTMRVFLRVDRASNGKKEKTVSGSDTIRAGDVAFPRLNRVVHAVIGRAVIWINSSFPDGDTRWHRAIHATHDPGSDNSDCVEWLDVWIRTNPPPPSSSV